DLVRGGCGDALTLALTGRHEADEVDAVGEPLRTRLPAGVGRLAVAARLLAGVFLFPGGAVVQDLLAAAGVAALAVIWPPLREALHRGARLLAGGSSAPGNPRPRTTSRAARHCPPPPTAPTAPTDRPSPRDH